MAEAESSLKILSDENYIRNRIHPLISDRDYLHLTDLARLVGTVAGDVKGRVFDYGSGGAPYAGLFKNCSGFVAADLEPGPKVDLVLRPDGMTGEPDESYDFILSTQVLEHVREPSAYLRECWRILKPGGRILATTHGMVEEHGCPHDYQRWTARGLHVLFEKCGYEVIRSGKLTAEIRGIVQMTNTFAHHLRYPQGRAKHLALAVVRKLYLAAGMPLLHRFANLFDSHAIVDMEAPESIYIAIFTHARKPR